MIKLDKKHSGVFAAGVLFGTAGIKLLSSKDAKKVYTNCTAAVLRAKDCVMKTVSKVPRSRKMQKIFMQKHSRSTKIAQQLRKHLKILLKKKHLKKQKKLQQKRNKNKAPAERNCRCFS